MEMETSCSVACLSISRMTGLKVVDFYLSSEGLERLLKSDIQEPRWTAMGLSEENSGNAQLMLLFSCGDDSEGVEDFSYQLLKKRRNLVIAGGFVDEFVDINQSPTCDDRFL